MLYLVLMVCAFSTAVCLVLGMHNVMFASRLAVLDRLETYTMDSFAAEEIAAARGKGLRGELLNVLGMIGRLSPRRSKMENLQRKLMQAYVLMRAEEFVGMVVLFGAGVFVLFYLLSGNILLSLLLALVSFKIPGIMVESIRTRRMQALNQQLPETLDILTSGLRAGFSFPQAMSVVSKEMEAPVSVEFGRVIKENAMGKTLEESLQNLSERTDSEDVDMFITALIIQKQVGGNLAEVLDNIAITIRERVRIQGEIKTLTAQGKMSAIIITLLPVALAAFMFITNPDYMMVLVQEPIGLAMAGTAVALEFIGIYFISRIIAIEI